MAQEVHDYPSRNAAWKATLTTLTKLTQLTAKLRLVVFLLKYVQPQEGVKIWWFEDGQTGLL